MSTLGARIRKMRLRKGYELDKLAYLTGMDSEMLAKLEGDEFIDLTVKDVILLAKTLDAPLDYILVGDPKSEEEAEEGSEIQIDEHSFLRQVINEEILEYMGHYPITFWANLFRKMCRKDISPDGMCRLIDAVETVKPGDDNGNGSSRNRQR
jgi:transcriptional regulator with XRE-family HTH domain